MSWTVGSQPPAGYVDWHEWAEVQLCGGLTQTLCPICERWFFPQENHVAAHKVTPPPGGKDETR